MRFQLILKYLMHLLPLDQHGQKKIYFNLNLSASYWISVECHDTEGFFFSHRGHLTHHLASCKRWSFLFDSLHDCQAILQYIE